MTAAFSTLRPLLDLQLAARFSRGNKALVKIGEDEEMRTLKIISLERVASHLVSRRGATQFTLKCSTICSSVTVSRSRGSLSL